jgi:hypothetical protein
MKKIKQLGLLALVSLMFFATACKKKPSAQIYNTWSLTSVEMPDADSVTLSKMVSGAVVYTFSKDGKYKSTIMNAEETGTFEINDEGTSMSTTNAGGQTEMLNVKLTASNLELSKGNDKMMFTVKK